MKIGILTYFGDLNCGTNLQAYSTLCVVRSIFPLDKVEIVNYQSFTKRNIPYLRGGITYKSLKNDIIRIVKYKLFYKNFLPRSSKSFISSNVEKSLSYINSLHYDLILVGADTVLELHREKDGLSAFWLSPLIKCTKVIIAASSRNVTYEALTINQRKLMHASLSDFHFCGVRDNATFRLISSFQDLRFKMQILPDPTFCLSIDYSYIEKYLYEKNIDLSKPTVCFHLLRTDLWGHELALKFKEVGYQVASFRPNKYSDILLNDLSPLEQLGVYKYFRLMITHRFHDTIFCLKNNTPMITYTPDEQYTNSFGESKYYSLLDSFDLIDSNFIKSRDQITASNIFNLHYIAIENFRSKIIDIDAKIKDFSNQYIEFVDNLKTSL